MIRCGWIDRPISKKKGLESSGTESFHFSFRLSHF